MKNSSKLEHNEHNMLFLVINKVQHTMYFQALVIYTYVTSVGQEGIFKQTKLH